MRFTSERRQDLASDLIARSLVQDLLGDLPGMTLISILKQCAREQR